jgi:pilus assembly protein Flp/PilA
LIYFCSPTDLLPRPTSQANRNTGTPHESLYRSIALLNRLKSDRRAVTALEYGIIAGVLGLVLITIFTSFGGTLSSLFATIGASV